MRRRHFLGLMIAQAACVRAPRPALARAARYLWKQQAGDGGWHSTTYGLLRSGQSLTPFVLGALLQIPQDLYPLPANKVDRALAFLERNTRGDGAVGMMDPGIPDYPNYSTALAIQALCHGQGPGWESHVARMVEYLRRQQFAEPNGWTAGHPAYGAWGMGGEVRTPPDTGHVDLSMTRHVLEALRAAGVPVSDPVFQRARSFVQRCQNLAPSETGEADGGFFFSTTEFDTNKAGHDGKRFRSYGSTTADGILCLLACGASPADREIEAARQWLTTRHRDMSVPGFIGEAYHRWPRGLAFYYGSASTRAFRALQVDAVHTVVEGLMRSQRSDGSWSNPENLVKEDDPLIATPFAIHALVGA